jgi:hypothetical protein
MEVGHGANMSEDKTAEASLEPVAQPPAGSAVGAEVYAFRNHPDDAMQWPERAYTKKGAGLYAIKRDWLLKGLEEDRRYNGFLKKMNLPE